MLILPISTMAKDQYIWPNHSFSLTYGVSFHDSSIQLGTQSGGGFIIDTEDTLGLKETQASLRFNYDWTFSKNKRHTLSASWYRFHRSGTKSLLEDIKYEDKDGNEVVLNAGTEISSIFNFDIIRLFYAYSFFKDDRITISGGGGFYIMPIEVGVGEVGQERTVNDLIAPLPTFKLKTDISLTKNWLLNTEFNFFYIKFGEYSGQILSNSTFVDYRLYKGLFLGLGFESFKIDIKMDSNNSLFEAKLDGRVILSNQSLLLRLKYLL